MSSELLPIRISGAQFWELEQLGFKFGAEVDELFTQARLPAGWSKVATDSVLLSDLLDGLGCKSPRADNFLDNFRWCRLTSGRCKCADVRLARGDHN